MASLLCQNDHHSSLLVERKQSEEANKNVWELLGGHDDQRPVGKFGLYAWVTPLLFSKDILEFLMTTESQDFGLMSHPKGSGCWQYGVPVTILGR